MGDSLIRSLLGEFSDPTYAHRSGRPLAKVVYADPGMNDFYYRDKKPDSVAAYVRVDLLKSHTRLLAAAKAALAGDMTRLAAAVKETENG